MEIEQEGYEQFDINMDWFLTAHNKPQVQVIFNDMYSQCLGNCDFEYFEELTPTIESVFPNQNLTAGSSVLEVKGTNIENLVISKPHCIVFESSYDTVKCMLADDICAGSYNIQAYDLNNGTPNLPNGEISVEVDFSVISLSERSVAVGGGHTTLAGTSLSCDMDIAVYRNERYKFPCKINQENCSYNQLDLECSFFAYSPGQELYVNGRRTNLLLGFDKGPKLTALHDPESDIYYNHVFPTQVSSQKYISLMAHTQEGGFGEDITKVDVYIGEKIVPITGVFSKTKIGLDLPVLAPGTYPIRVYIEDIGYMVSGLSIEVDFKVLSMDTNTGSLYGGTPVTFNGLGFTTKNPEDLTVKFGQNNCQDIEIISDTKISCQVPSSVVNKNIDISLDADNNISWENSIEIYEGDTVQWNWNFDSQVYDMSMKICEASAAGSYRCCGDGFSSQAENTKFGSYQHRFNIVGLTHVTTGCMTNECTKYLITSVTVLPRPSVIVSKIHIEINGHDHTSQATRTWVYDGTKTSTVTSTNVDETGLSVLDLVKINGTNFSNQRDTNWQVRLGNYHCNIIEVSDNQICCKMEVAQQPELLTNLPLKLTNEHGDAGILTKTVAESFIVLLPAVISITSGNEGSMNGGYHLKLAGIGMDAPGTQVLFDGFSECEIIQSSYRHLSCSTPRYETGDPSLYTHGQRLSREIIVSSGTIGVYDNQLSEKNFYYFSEITPIIDEITLSTELVEKNTKVSWSIQQSAEHGDYVASFGGVECHMTNLENECVVSDSVPPGRAWFKLTDTIYGNAYISREINNFLAPATLTEVFPESGSIHGGQHITVYGTGFNDLSKVSLNGFECTTIEKTRTQIQCLTPKNQGNNLATIKVEPGFENTLVYKYDENETPLISGISSSRGLAGQEITLFGKDLGYQVDGTYVRFDGADCEIVKSSGDHITHTLDLVYWVIHSYSLSLSLSKK